MLKFYQNFSKINSRSLSATLFSPNRNLATSLRNLRRYQHPICYKSCQVIPNVRFFFSFPDGSTTKEYSENKVIGYSMQQMYDVVANVDDYKHFVPWCVASKTFQKSETHARANLEVGFPPVSEKYTSILTLTQPNLVKSECMDGTLFNHLTCIWKLSKGPANIPNSCLLNFYVSFEFKSVLHSQLSYMFFDEVVKKMVSAFETRCETLYGPSSLVSSKYDSSRKIRRAAANSRRSKINPKKLTPEGT